jgi:iron only hydrogenase large subunit-like protein
MKLYTGKKLEKVDFEQLRGMDGIRHAEVDFNGFMLKIGIAHGLGNARKLLEDVGPERVNSMPLKLWPVRWLYRRRRSTFASWRSEHY